MQGQNGEERIVVPMSVDEGGLRVSVEGSGQFWHYDDCDKCSYGAL